MVLFFTIPVPDTMAFRKKQGHSHILGVNLLAYAQMSNKPAARADYKKCLGFDPEDKKMLESLKTLHHDDLYDNEFHSAPPHARELYDAAEKILGGDAPGKYALTRAIVLLNQAIQAAGGRFPRARYLKAQTYYDMDDLDNCVRELKAAMAESRNEFQAQQLLAVLSVINCPKQPPGLKKGMTGPLIANTEDFYTGYGQALSIGCPQSRAFEPFRASVGEKLSEVDKLLVIFKRLSDHGLRDFNYYLFSAGLLDVQQELQVLDNHLQPYGGVPYPLDRIPRAILAVPDDKVYYMSANIKEEINQLANRYRRIGQIVKQYIIKGFKTNSNDWSGGAICQQ